jgi:hypothetical protein
VGKYGVATGQTTEASCTACIANSNSPPQSSARSVCTCDAGYGGDAGTGVCTACVAGKWKPAGNIVDCTDCVEGKYGTATGQTTEASCTVCDAGKYQLGTGGSTEASCTVCGVGKYGVETGQTTEASCRACGSGKYGVATGQTTEASCAACGAGKYGVATGQTAEASCTACGAGKYGVATGGSTEASCTACGTGTYTAREAATVCMTCEPGKYSSGGDDICTSFVTTGTSECCAIVDQLENEVRSLKYEVDSLKQLVTPRSSFIPTGNRTIPAWGNSVYTRCQLPFSWTELNKVRSFFRYYPIVPPYFFCLSDVFHYIRGTKSVKLFSGLEVSVDICRKLCTRAGCA